MKTLKALCGLAIAPLFVLLAEAGVPLLPCQRHSQMRGEMYAAIRADLRTVWDSRELWAAVFMAVILLIIGLGAVMHFARAEWWQGAFDLAVATFLAARE